MSDSFGLVVAVAAAWLAVGLGLAIVMGRRGHNSFGWFVLGALLGPLGVVLAVEAGRHGEQLRTTLLAGGIPATVGTGPVDVLVGYDGSPEAAVAMHAVVVTGPPHAVAENDVALLRHSDAEPARQGLRRSTGRVAGGRARAGVTTPVSFTPPASAGAHAVESRRSQWA